jgi:hypothetical protein
MTSSSNTESSEVSSINARIARLVKSEGNWHTTYLWLICFTVLLGLGTFFSQYFETGAAKERADAEAELNRVKDRIRDAELAQRDVKIAEAVERAGKADERASANAREAAEMRLRAANLEAEIQPRYLTEEQQQRIADRLRSLSVPKLLIASEWSNSEAAQLARQIRSTLNRAGMGLGDNFIDRIASYPEIPGALFGGGGFSGPNIHVGIEIWGSDKNAVESTATVFRSIGKLAVATPQSDSPFSVSVYGPLPLVIFVGVKPIPEVK